MSADQTVLVGDVGGTSVRFAVAHMAHRRVEIDQFEKLPGDDFGSFEDALETYLTRYPDHRPPQALFALAGPIKQGCVNLTNRPWQIRSDTLENRFGFAKASLVNDFAAMARSVPEISDETLEEIIPGEHRPGAPILVAGAGTGYGVATLVKRPSGGWLVVSGEGGHIAYAPRTEREFALTRLLQKKHGYVSNELVCSGIGMAPVHEALCELSGLDYTPLAPHIVLQKADEGDPICRELCELRANALMGSVGDAALIAGARGGVVLAGGVSSRLAPFLKRAEAVDRFRNRGPQTAYMTDMSVRLITHETAPLIGAATLYFEQDNRS